VTSAANPVTPREELERPHQVPETHGGRWTPRLGGVRRRGQVSAQGSVGGHDCLGAVHGDERGFADGLRRALLPAAGCGPARDRGSEAPRRRLRSGRHQKAFCGVGTEGFGRAAVEVGTVFDGHVVRVVAARVVDIAPRTVRRWSREPGPLPKPNEAVDDVDGFRAWRSGSVLVSEARSRWFESNRPDQKHQVRRRRSVVLPVPLGTGASLSRPYLFPRACGGTGRRGALKKRSSGPSSNLGVHTNTTQNDKPKWWNGRHVGFRNRSSGASSSLALGIRRRRRCEEVAEWLKAGACKVLPKGNGSSNLSFFTNPPGLAGRFLWRGSGRRQ
jgi:hypothetical protein